MEHIWSTRGLADRLLRGLDVKDVSPVILACTSAHAAASEYHVIVAFASSRVSMAKCPRSLQDWSDVWSCILAAHDSWQPQWQSATLSVDGSPVHPRGAGAVLRLASKLALKRQYVHFLDHACDGITVDDIGVVLSLKAELSASCADVGGLLLLRDNRFAFLDHYLQMGDEDAEHQSAVLVSHDLVSIFKYITEHSTDGPTMHIAPLFGSSVAILVPDGIRTALDTTIDQLAPMVMVPTGTFKSI